MYLIAGLGNPTKQYEHTRHNIGFDTVTYLADRYHISMNTKKFQGICGSGYIEGQKVLLLMPQTYMNLSGQSVSEAAAFYKLDPAAEVIVIYDDIALEPGNIRVRKKRKCRRAQWNQEYYRSSGNAGISAHPYRRR